MSEPRDNGRGRKSKNIQFARSLSAREMMAVLQNALMEARMGDDKMCSLMTEIVHEIKFRLNYYYEVHGEVKRDEYEDD